jgi:uncharacterized membrane protein YdcZ (DUF606 family)
MDLASTRTFASFSSGVLVLGLWATASASRQPCKVQLWPVTAIWYNYLGGAVGAFARSGRTYYLQWRSMCRTIELMAGLALNTSALGW